VPEACPVVVRAVAAGDPTVARLAGHWGSGVARAGELVDPGGLPGLVAERNGTAVGALTYAVRGTDCEVVTLDATPSGTGTGRALLDEVVSRARDAGCARVWLVTTNDNTRALRFYQQYGFELAGVALGAVDESRRGLKPTIPATGEHGIPIHHEFRLVLELANVRAHG
jgi:GNAT superfamily N-acetyltransferase